MGGAMHRFGAACLVVMVLGTSVAVAQGPSMVRVGDFGVTPCPSLDSLFLGVEAIRRELKITDAQGQQQEEIQRRRFSEIRLARRDVKDDAKLRVARDAITRRAEAAFRASLVPGQRARLEQIQLQAQGPLAFLAPDLLGAYSDVPLAVRLKLSEAQIRQVRVIAREGRHEIAEAASFPIIVDAGGGLTGQEAIRKLVDGAEFQDAKRKARQAGRDAWDAVIRRIEGVLTGPQRESYRGLLGEPFDLGGLRSFPEERDRQPDIDMVVQAFGDDGRRFGTGMDAQSGRPVPRGRGDGWRP